MIDFVLPPWLIVRKSQNKKNVSHHDQTTRRSTNHINLYDHTTDINIADQSRTQLNLSWKIKVELS